MLTTLTTVMLIMHHYVNAHHWYVNNAHHRYVNNADHCYVNNADHCYVNNAHHSYVNNAHPSVHSLCDQPVAQRYPRTFHQRCVRTAPLQSALINSDLFQKK